MRKTAITVTLAALVVLIALCTAASAGDHGTGCPYSNFYNGALENGGGIYFDVKGHYDNAGATQYYIFENLPDGRQVVRMYPGIWLGSPSPGRVTEWYIEINGHTDYFNFTEPGSLPFCNLDCPPEDGTGEHCTVSCSGYGVCSVTYNASPYVITGDNDITYWTSEQIYQVGLLAVYENASMEKLQYWVKEGHEYPDTTPYHVYFSETGNTGPIDPDNISTVEYYTYGYPHCPGESGWPDLNGNYIGSPNITKSAGYANVLYGWTDIAPAYIGTPDNCFLYPTLGNDRMMVPVLGIHYGEDGGDEDLEFGDAPDPAYPSLLSSDGARHFPIYTEYLGLQSTGDGKDFELDANIIDQDLFDDGLLTFALAANNSTQTVDFEVTNLIPDDQTLIVNILLDLNQDDDWNDVVGGQPEHVVRNQSIPLTGVADGIFTSLPFSTVGATPGQTWMRITLTRHTINSGWNGTMASAGYSNPFECGETEDWNVSIIEEEPQEDPLEFGDAPDNSSDPTDYPSLLASDGARHYPTTTECLGLNVTTPPDWKDFEPDANVPDLDLFDDGLLTFALAANNSTQTVDFEVTNLIPDDQTLIVNILLDLNQDGDWNDVVGGQSEHVVQNQLIPLTGVADGIFTSLPFSTVGATPGQTWMRITLTRHQINPGWNGTMASAGYSNPFECGETEDWSVSIDGGAGGTCGDVNDDGVVNWTDVETLWYDYADHPYPGAYTITNEWAADVNCDGVINMADVMILWYDVKDYPNAGDYEVNCCG